MLLALRARTMAVLEEVPLQNASWVAGCLIGSVLCCGAITLR